MEPGSQYDAAGAYVASVKPGLQYDAGSYIVSVKPGSQYDAGAYIVSVKPGSQYDTEAYVVLVASVRHEQNVVSPALLFVIVRTFVATI